MSAARRSLVVVVLVVSDTCCHHGLKRLGLVLRIAFDGLHEVRDLELGVDCLQRIVALAVLLDDAIA